MLFSDTAESFKIMSSLKLKQPAGKSQWQGRKRHKKNTDMKNQVILKTIKHVKAVIKTSKDASERAGGGVQQTVQPALVSGAEGHRVAVPRCNFSCSPVASDPRGIR